MLDAVFKRKSIRHFLNRSIENNKIEAMLKAAMQAPSAGNQQSWEFLVIQKKETLNKLSNMGPHAQSLQRAPLAIVFLANASKLKHQEFWQQDMSAAIENLLLQAVELDLGAVWLGVAPKQSRMEFIKKLFCLPDSIIPFAVICIGYPTEQNLNIDRFDKNKVHYEYYGHK